MQELKARPTAGTSPAHEVYETRQSRRLLLALVLLLVAIAVVLGTDRKFWFGSDQSDLDSDVATPSVAPRPKSAPNAANQAQPAPAPAAKTHIPAANSAAPKAANSPVVATTRTVLPPLDVEVVAGDAHRTIHPGTNARKLEITHSGSIAPAQSTGNLSASTNAVERERISTDVAPQPASYPLLAQHMNVQGSVVLQAIIGSDGIIEDLRVVSGPTILAAAAQQAVREWRFKPILQNGQPVETKARITVNFTIKVADSTKTS
jgi:protein TonB